MKLDRAGDLEGALDAYQAALALTPDDPDLLAAVADVADRLDMPQVAERLWARVGALAPDRLDAVDGRARALRSLGRFDEAIEVLRAALLVQPQEARLWSTLGVTLTQQCQPDVAITFFDEAIRLDPRSAVALYNRGSARFDLGELEAAGEDFAKAAKAARKPADAAMIAFAQATLTLARGDVGAGWDAYEARFARDYDGAVRFDAPGQRWRPSESLAGKRLLVVAEQGLGDELMFANVLPDVVEAVGPEGKLSLAVAPRLVDLFARSFPTADVSAHATDMVGHRRRRSVPGAPRNIQLWTPMGSLLRRFRRTVGDFPQTPGYLTPDPARVAHWRGWLGEGPPAVGFTWRSGQVLGDRRRFYAALEDWAPLLRTPGVRFVNLQYGECADDLAALRALGGVDILEPPGLDLREDLEGLAGLCVSLDLVVAVTNATAALAGACGAPLAVLSPAATWPRLGTAAYPWYPQATGLTPPKGADWSAPFAEAAALAAALAPA